MSAKQPEALRLANELEKLTPFSLRRDLEPTLQAATELRRLHAANLDCMEWYEAVKSERDELLEALQTATECLAAWMEIADPEDVRDYDNEALEGARSAIAKAGGAA